MLTKIFTFVPVGGDKPDNVLITEDGCPWAMAFIDMFFDKEEKDITREIKEGNPFKVKVSFELVERGE